jgi:hypothetical protein
MRQLYVRLIGVTLVCVLFGTFQFFNLSATTDDLFGTHATQSSIRHIRLVARGGSIFLT